MFVYAPVCHRRADIGISSRCEIGRPDTPATEGIINASGFSLNSLLNILGLLGPDAVDSTYLRCRMLTLIAAHSFTYFIRPEKDRPYTAEGDA